MSLVNLIFGFAANCKVSALTIFYFILIQDCIDNLNTKIDLIKYCHDHKIRILASMGAGAKADPSRIQIADIRAA